MTANVQINAGLGTAIAAVDIGAATAAAVTITIATPGVVTDTAHGYGLNQPFTLSTTGALPTGLAVATTYYVVSPTTNTYQIAATPNGSAIATSGTQSGVHTRQAIVYAQVVQITGNVNIGNANGNGRALPGNSAPVVLNSQTPQFVAAAAAATQLGSTGGAADNLDGVLIIPLTAAAGAVTVLWDGTNTRTIFAGGGVTALPTLVPFFVPCGFVSGNVGGFKVTTGTNVQIIAVGNFT